MKGKILGFNEAEGTGAISAEDGTRYRFTRADWRGERSPTTGAGVDFEGADGGATEIYPLAGSVRSALSNINVDLDGISATPGGEKVKQLFTASLAVPLALVVLLACFLPMISSPIDSFNLFGLGDSRTGIGAVSRAASMTAGGGLGMMKTLLVLRYAAPLTALWLIWAAWSAKGVRIATLIAGASAIVAGLLPIGLRSAVIDAMPDFVADQMADTIGLGFGIWLIIAAGIALIATGLGLLRNPLAKG